MSAQRRVHIPILFAAIIATALAVAPIVALITWGLSHA